MWLQIAFYINYKSIRMGKTSGISHLKQKILQIHGSCSILCNLPIHELFVSENFRTSLPESLFLIEQKYIHDKCRIMTLNVIQL